MTDRGNLTATGSVAWRREAMTFSPMMSAAGIVPQHGTIPDQSTGPGRAGGYVPRPRNGADAADGAYPVDAPSPDDATYPYPAYADAPAGPGPATHPGEDTRPGEAAYSPDDAGADAAAYPGDDAAGGQGQDDDPWPYQSYLELGPLPTAAPCARLHTRLVLWEWELGALAEPAALVVAELVTNAVQASAGSAGSRFAGQWAPGTPPVRLWLSADGHRLVVQVWDGSDQPPAPQPVTPDADSGRGLLLVAALSAEWGCYTPEESSGKVVWAVITG